MFIGELNSGRVQTDVIVQKFEGIRKRLSLQDFNNLHLCIFYLFHCNGLRLWLSGVLCAVPLQVLLKTQHPTNAEQQAPQVRVAFKQPIQTVLSLQWYLSHASPSRFYFRIIIMQFTQKSGWLGQPVAQS